MGDSDEGDDNYSKLGWFELTNADGFQYMIGGAGAKEISVRNPTISDGDDIKILRIFVASEFVPYEKKIATDIVCDVDGRSGAGQDVLVDVLSSDDLLAIPAGSILVDTLPTSIKGVLTAHVDGFSFVELLLQQLMARGFWNWEGVFKVRARPKVADLVGGEFMITDDEIIGEPELKSARLDDVRNIAEVRYKYDYVTGDFEESETDEDTDSQDRFGKSDIITVDANMIRDQADAITLLNHALSVHS